MNLQHLGWDNAVRTDCPNPYPCKNGSLFTTTSAGQVIRIWAYLGIFKCNVPVVAIVNSPLPAGNDIIPLIATAYRAAQVPRPCCASQSTCPS